MSKVETDKTLTGINLSVQEILNDYRIISESRFASLLGRKEVFMGKAKFGIFGDGKELAQVAMAKAFKKGDFRSGYYRDQTFMLAIGELTFREYFAQLYAHTDLEAEPNSAGRQMGSHYATRLLDEKGNWRSQTNRYNTAADLSPTAAQIPKIVGLGLASKIYRHNLDLKHLKEFSNKGNEVAFGTIGNASTSEGLFLEAFNAIGVLQIPVVMAVWDDEYGISVPKEYHTTKSSISKALAGFQRTKHEKGFEIMVVKGWDYIGLCQTFKKAGDLARKHHVPVLVHVTEMTQPQGHSTSGSHQRYKSKERLKWEKDYDCITKVKEWILDNEICEAEDLKEIDREAQKKVKIDRDEARKAFIEDVKSTQIEAHAILVRLARQSIHGQEIKFIIDDLSKAVGAIRQDTIRAVKKALRTVRFEDLQARKELIDWLDQETLKNEDRFDSCLHNETANSALKVEVVPAKYTNDSKLVDGREVVQACFDSALSRDPRILAFGEDLGKIGDVNQGFAGLQEKYGILRVDDTGIRESAIIGQGVGLALRGLRPLAEIQYLDYVAYTLQTLTDDLASLHYRTKGGQSAPLVIRTRGHRLEGIWHSGSPMGMLINSLRGIYILTPRNMTQAAGFYNTIFRADDPALLVECLNGYRLKERIPENIGEFTVPLGVPEVIREGTDITIVTYGSMCRIALDGAKQLAEIGISCQIVDVQTLIPFDIHHQVVESLKKTNRIIFADEDGPGGASAYMMEKVIEEQNGYQYLDSKPITVTAKDHRPAYASDGDYFSKPNAEDIFDAAYSMMSESDPKTFPEIY